MKKRRIFLYLFFALTLISFVGAACTLDVSMVNQDPYPAVPGDYVKLVFQVEGVQNAECGDLTAELIEAYPISFDTAESNKITISSGTYLRNHKNSLLAPFKVRLDENALNGENQIDFMVSRSGGVPNSGQIFSFNLTVEEVRTDFEVFVKDYDYTTNILTLEVLNIGESDVEAVTLEISNQEKISIKGANTNIIGDLDSNEYTSADFEASPQNGEFKIKILYTDKAKIRRTLEKSVSFDSSYFLERKASEKGISTWTYVFIVLVIVVLVLWMYRRYKRRKKKHLLFK